MREVVRMVADALRADLARVNALAAGVPVLSSETAAASVRVVYDATSSGWAARAMLPPAADASVTRPCAVVRLVGDATYTLPVSTSSGGTRFASATLTLAVQYVGRETDTVAGLAAAARWLRAARAWAFDLARRSEADVSRTRGGASLAIVTGLRLSEAYHDDESDAITGALLLDCTTREVLPDLPAFP